MGSMWTNNVLRKYKDGKSQKFLLEPTIQHISVFGWNAITLTLKVLSRPNKNKSEVFSVITNQWIVQKFFKFYQDIDVIYTKLLVETMIRQ